jgi:3-hydroxy-9,10-secoandrosta-1,3,5(10)-triene-9,17-dione monooxygenase reductase component
MSGATATDEQIRHALGHFATGVTVVTSVGPDGAPVGTTASAVSSLSLTPPLLLVCLERRSETLNALRTHGAFAINVLADGQQDLSSNFARRGAASSWEDVEHQLGLTGSPRLDGVLAVLDCELEQCLDGGDHEIVVGRLRELEVAGDDRAPLLHYRGVYASLAA